MTVTTGTHEPEQNPDFVDRALGELCGIYANVQTLPPAAADPAGVFHASVAREDFDFASAGGGVARTRAEARTAAVGEALERYAASTVRLPLVAVDDLVEGASVLPASAFTLHSEQQRQHPHYPGEHYTGGGDHWFTDVFDLTSNQQAWVPAALVGLTNEFGAYATSPGLALHSDPWLALLRAAEELIERDAFMTTWFHQLGGKLVEDRVVDDRFGGRIRVFDITPDYSTHPVAIVTGTLPLQGQPRHSMGVACRPNWGEAVERAELECLQGITFVGQKLAREPELHALTAANTRNFDHHSVYYAANPDEWEQLPLHRFAIESPAPQTNNHGSSGELLRSLADHLNSRGVRLFYRDLSTIDLLQLGLTAVRALSPELTPIHHDHVWPFLGGRAADLSFHYSDGESRSGGRPYPSPFPHGLG